MAIVLSTCQFMIVIASSATTSFIIWLMLFYVYIASHLLCKICIFTVSACEIKFVRMRKEMPLSHFH